MNHNESLDNQQLRDGLLGALVGLGRAAEGNKNRPTEETDRVLIDGLRMVMLKDVPELMMIEQIKKTQNEKFKLVPRCITCKKQCGRNDDYRVSDLKETPNDIFNMKLRMLSEIILIAETGNKNDYLLSLLYDALFWIGKKGNLIEIGHMTELVHTEFCKCFLSYLLNEPIEEDHV